MEIWFIQKTKPKMNYERIGETIKKSDPKIEKKPRKNRSEITACEKTTSKKANFCSNTVFSLYFKIKAKKFYAAKPLAFSLQLLFRRDKNHYFNLTSKIMKCKKTEHQYNPILGL